MGEQQAADAAARHGARAADDDPHRASLRAPPPDFELRRPTWADLPAVAELLAAISRARIGRVTVRLDDLRTRWLGATSFDDMLLVEHPSATSLVAAASFDADLDPWTGEPDLHVELHVHPAWTGRGLGAFLLSRAEDRARLAARRSGHEHVVLRTSVVDGDAATRAFFATRGFTPVRHLLELRLDLHAPTPVPVWPPGVTCRSYVPGVDDHAMWRTHQRAFADVATHLPLDEETFLEDRIHRGQEPALVQLAWHGPETVGLLVGRAGTQVAAEDGWIRDLGVVPAWRRRGVGMALLRTAFAAFRARGLTGVALEVDDVTLDGAVALYRRAGMRVTRRTDVLERGVHAESASDVHPAGDPP